MQTPGEILAAARKKREWTVAQVAGLTKIPEAMVEAVEADEYHKLSGPLYVRSFLRTIAKAVGEDPRRVLDLYGEMTGGEPGAAAAPGSTVWKAEEVVVQKLGMSWQPWLYSAAGIILVVVVILFAVRGCGKDEPAPPASTPAAATADTQTATPVEAVADTVDSGRSAAAPVTVACPRAADLAFTTGRGDLKLVVRLPARSKIEVRIDGQQDFAPAEWPDGEDAVPVFPGGEIVPGRVYRCRDGFVAAWRAEDHFGLKLERVEGAAVLLEDRNCSLAGLRPGQEIILDRHSVGL